MTDVYKIVVLGGGAVGKSAVTISFTHSHFIEYYDPTIEDQYYKQWSVDNQVAYMDILDTAGQEDYSVLRDQYMRAGEAFIMVYDVTNFESFEEIGRYYEQIRRARDLADHEHVPHVLLGNKCDLDHTRQVSTFVGQELAKTMGGAFLECSAKNRVNIDEAFETLVRSIRTHRNPEQAKNKKAANKKKAACSLF